MRIARSGQRASPTWSVAQWRRLGRRFEPELRDGLEAVLVRLERAGGGSPDAALLQALAMYELELQRVLARLSWLEQDVDAAARHGAPRYNVPAVPGLGTGHAAEDSIEEDPEAESGW